MRLSPGLLLVALLTACADPTPLVPTNPDGGSEDAGKPASDLGGATPDAGAVQASTGQLHPFVEEASGGNRILRGRLGAHTVQTATSTNRRLQGGFRPLSR